MNNINTKFLQISLQPFVKYLYILILIYITTYQIFQENFLATVSDKQIVLSFIIPINQGHYYLQNF
ncbi:hypothetical protein pb186bvf_014701 [Paramecium bursaria]